MKDVTSRPPVTLIIILSLTWNIIIIVLLFCIQDDIHLHSPFTITVEQEEKKNKESDSTLIYQANKLISFGSSPFGTTIISQAPNLKSSTQPNILKKLIQEEPEQQPIFSQEQEAINEQTQTESENQIPCTQENDITEEEKQSLDQERSEKSDQEQLQPSTAIIQEAILKAAYKKQKQNKQKIIPTFEQKKQIMKSTAIKKNLNLAEIVQGYMHHVAQEQEQSVETQIRSLPSSKQLALQVYSTKIFTLIEQAAKVNQKMLYASGNHTTDATLILTVDQNGKLIEAYLTPPLQEKEVREWIFTFIHKVGLFPPIPKHLKKEKITLSYPLKIDIQQGFGTYSLYYGLCNRY
ncbi:hypothetical protein E3J79_03275 [Candidatus Dependentiae bacterium]|nr:MAG: hypothetical protein E3J79_03275 [Candidatus Dependentiae bacterium]